LSFSSADKTIPAADRKERSGAESSPKSPRPRGLIKRRDSDLSAGGASAYSAFSGTSGTSGVGGRGRGLPKPQTGPHMDMKGENGPYRYMAPEIYRREDYNHKARGLPMG
jgi:hypothetical protein